MYYDMIPSIYLKHIIPIIHNYQLWSLIFMSELEKSIEEKREKSKS